MTDARLAAAVEAAARAQCRVYCGLTDDEPDIWDQHRPDVRDMHQAHVEHIVEAALAAADAWDAEQGYTRVCLSPVTEDDFEWDIELADVVIGIRNLPEHYGERWLTPRPPPDTQKPPLDGSAGSGGTPGPQVGDEGSGGGFREPRPATR